ERKGLTLHDVQVATKIRRKYLEALERGDDAQLPPEVYTRGFIRAYAKLVGLDGMELAQAYSRWKRAQSAAGAAADQEGAAPTAEGASSTPTGGVGAWDGPERVASHPAAGAGPAGPEERGGARMGRVPRPEGELEGPEPWTQPPLVGPLPRPARWARRGDAAVPGMARRRGRPWLRWGVALLGLLLLAGGILYVVGEPPAPPQAGRPSPGSGPGGPAPGTQPAVPGGEGGGGTGAGSGGAEPASPAQEPPGPQVTVRREGDDVYYTIVAGAPAGASGAAAGSPLTVTLEATDRVWVRVRDADGRVVFERLMQRGDRQQLDLGEGLDIRVGYPRGLALRVEATDLEVPQEESPLNLHLEPDAATGAS
ncbi:MAG TPA: RodZ domain-containing protein, partial [Thermaerobacter sp.]